jgi:hypothetical protein
LEALFLLALVAATSAAAISRARRRGRDGGPGALGAAARDALECAGLTVVFFVANLGLGALLTLVIRALTPLFVSLYLSADVSLLVLSALQAFVYQRWRASAAARPPTGEP